MHFSRSTMGLRSWKRCQKDGNGELFAFSASINDVYVKSGLKTETTDPETCPETAKSACNRAKKKSHCLMSLISLIFVVRADLAVSGHFFFDVLPAFDANLIFWPCNCKKLTVAVLLAPFSASETHIWPRKVHFRAILPVFGLLFAVSGPVSGPFFFSFLARI